MFTGIIECLGKIESITTRGANLRFWVASPISHQLKIDQSVSHNGVCLTVEETLEDSHVVTAIAETLGKTNLGKLKIGDFLNLERCLQINDRIDGHIVQGHVDCTATCLSIVDKKGSYELRFRYPEKYASFVIEKGSIAIDGISLTLHDITKNAFSVSIIPYTHTHTSLQFLQPQQEVNVEFDMVGKYIQRNLQLRQP